jgi:hypothetical protein
MNWWPRKEEGYMAQPEDMSRETAMKELAEILAGGFLRLSGDEANLDGTPLLYIGQSH